MNWSEETFRKLFFNEEADYLAFRLAYDVRISASDLDLDTWIDRLSVHTKDGELAWLPDRPNLVYTYEGWQKCDAKGVVLEEIPAGTRICWFEKSKSAKPMRMHAGLDMDSYELHRFVRHGPALIEGNSLKEITHTYWVRGKVRPKPKGRKNGLVA